MKSSPPSDGEQLHVVIRAELLKYLRGGRLFAILVLTGFIGWLMLALPPLLGSGYPSDVRTFPSTFLNFVSILMVLSATFFGSDAINSEFQQRTGYALFPSPIRRRIILLGKYAASALSSLLAVSLYYAIIIVSALAIYGTFPDELILSYYLAVVYMLSIMAFAFFLSSVMKGTTGSAVLTFFLLMMILPIIGVVLHSANIDPWFSITEAGGIVSSILTMPPSIGGGAGGPLQQTGAAASIPYPLYLPKVGSSLIVMVNYLIITLLASLYVFERREL
jgi:ABC-2 type transport system permease protein